MLTDVQIKSLKPRDKPYRVTDSHGLCIEIATSGSKLWRHRYRFKGVADMMALGKYPEVSLLDARQARDRNKQQLNQGINPKQKKVGNTDEAVDCLTFKDMMLKWHKHRECEWSADYAEDTTQRAERYLLPFIGNKRIQDITSPDMRNLLLQIQDAGLLDTLQKVKGIASRVFSYSVGMGVIAVNPVRDLPTDIFKKKPETHYATITEPNEIGLLLNTLDLHKGTIQVKTALMLAPHLFLRPAELTGLLWSEIDFDEKIIRISGGRMKMKNNHIVPMSSQVSKILNDFRNIDFNSDFVFPTPRNRNKCITTNALLASIRGLGINKETFTTHGFRHMASTRLNEMGFGADVIERQLAHSESNKVRAVYNQAQHLGERRKMMQHWSDCLDKLKRRYVT